MTASGAAGPYTFTTTNGALPAGLLLDPATGAVSGTPTALGTFTFTASSLATPGHVISIMAERTDPTSADNVVDDGPPGTNLDPLLNKGAATITVVNPVAVPEPASFILLSIGGLVLICRATRKRHPFV